MLAPLTALWSRAGLAARLTLGYLAIVLGVVAVLGITADWALGWALEQNAFALLRREAADAARVMPGLLDPGAPAGPGAALTNGLVVPGVGMTVLDGTGATLQLSGLDAHQLTPPPEPPAAAYAALRAGATEWSGIVGSGDERVAFLMVRLVGPPGAGPPKPGPPPVDPTKPKPEPPPGADSARPKPDGPPPPTAAPRSEERRVGKEG